MFFGLWFSFLIFIPSELGQSHFNRKTRIKLFISAEIHTKVMDGDLEQLPDLLRILLSIVICNHVYLRNNDQVDDWLRWKKLCNFEIVNEKLIALVVKGEVEIDEFIDVEVLQSWIVRYADIRNLVNGDKRTVIFADFWIEKVDLILKNEFVKVDLYLERFKQFLLLFCFSLPLLNYLDESAIFTIDDVLVLVDKIFDLRTEFLKSFAVFTCLVVECHFLNC